MGPLHLGTSPSRPKVGLSRKQGELKGRPHNFGEVACLCQRPLELLDTDHEQVLAEKAAWEFITTEKPNFDLATICNTYTFGPVQRQLPTLDAINTSNLRIRDLAQGKMREKLEPTAPVFTFVDVRDVALAHVRAIQKPQAGGKRFYVVGGYFSNKRLADVMRAAGFPELEGRLPTEGVAVDDFPDDVYGFDNTRSREVLGIEYRGLEESVVDTVRSILEWQARH